MPKSDGHLDVRSKSHPQQESRQRPRSGQQDELKSLLQSEKSQPASENSLAMDFSQSSFDSHVATLGDPGLAHSMYSHHRAMIFRRFQRDYGNRYVQRLISHIKLQRADGPQNDSGSLEDARNQAVGEMVEHVSGAVGSDGDHLSQTFANHGKGTIQRKGGLKGFLAGLFTSSRDEDEVTSEVTSEVNYDMAIEDVKKFSRSLGVGGSGYVYKAELKDDRDVAVKTPKNADQAKVLIAEAELMKRCPQR